MSKHLNLDSKIYIAGHSGMVGSNLYTLLKTLGYENLIVSNHSDLDLRCQTKVNQFISDHKPDYVFLIAGKVGGIQANIDFPGEYLYDNLMIASNIIEASRVNNINKLLYLGSSCIYPRLAKQPMKEEYLLTGSLEPTNEGYSIGKIAGLKLCEYYRKQYGCNYIAVMPPNLFGPGDNFSKNHSHVISALIQKVYNAKKTNASTINMWGTGIARREFLYVDDISRALLFLMKEFDSDTLINAGSGKDISIKELVAMICDIAGYEGNIVWDSTKPDGMPRKLMDSSRINKLGWVPQISLQDGLIETYSWYKQKIEGTKV